MLETKCLGWVNDARPETGDVTTPSSSRRQTQGRDEGTVRILGGHSVPSQWTVEND